MPTGVHIRDARQQLFEAAERVLLRDGPSALTSRAVTTEAGVAKGVLHRHFADFDAFLVELIRDRVVRIEHQAAALRASAGTGTVAGNLTEALIDLFDPVAVGIVGLVIFRDELRARLRQSRPAHTFPVATEAMAMVAAYLTDECELGRIAADADVGSLALSLVGGAHLLYADRKGTPPDRAAVGKLVTTVIADVVQRRLL
ncbi:TetR/AcrR family transcriptional regulator [Actinoallomurus iriomotensis]|uniref:TetR family transcriptional regulator n=1 Tax=Actinoallomurus iriomotensis TaxID=478107 RepID=A0A9W6RZY1_9ACTN|nr:TetR/AcrR family transcriptional regulator [Actinoallomurus iriomotensis]GLY84889.1 TetR family transcriptional regulator [Actinoallomurus iriomotensis]